jgi:hypothetical protein
MTRTLMYLGIAIGHLLLVAVYWLGSGDAAGTTMLLIFGIAMAFVLWILVPTFEDVGPTAPVDPAWHERADASEHGAAAPVHPTETAAGH